MKRPLLLPLVPLYAAGLALRELRLEHGWEKVRDSLVPGDQRGEFFDRRFRERRRW